MNTNNDHVVTLDVAEQERIIEVLASAFLHYPGFPLDPTGHKARRMVMAMLEAFAKAPGARLFGIVRHEQLACVAFVFTDGYEPKGLRLLLFLWRMLRVLGRQKFQSLSKVLAEKPERNERCLELLLLGTHPDYQRQGLGRIMLRHLFEFARTENYASVALETNKITPAFGFYQQEGFELEKEISLPGMQLCMMKRILN